MKINLQETVILDKNKKTAEISELYLKIKQLARDNEKIVTINKSLQLKVDQHEEVFDDRVKTLKGSYEKQMQEKLKEAVELALKPIKIEVNSLAEALKMKSEQMEKLKNENV